ncbi:MAG: hypothetical protein JWL72_3581 [Ilumatobacteraceae bacterium]|nr:hypothetical protein [Ilumatobacteraceae bacterium]
MIGQHLGFAAAVTNGDASASKYEPLPFSKGNWDASVSTLLEAFEGADLNAASVLVEIGPIALPNWWIVAAQLLDTAVHSWDIGQALGSWHEPAADITAAVADLARTIPDDERRGAPHGAFGPAVQTDGSPWERTLAHLGRSPHEALRRR